MSFNNLSDGQAERLAWLLEELGEAQQAVGKILRHGYHSYDPTNPAHLGNKADLERELKDVIKAINYMSQKFDINHIILDSYDMPIMMKYSHHQ